MIVEPSNSTTTKLQPMPASAAKCIASSQAHPGSLWVRTIYARHRSGQTVD